MIALLLVGSREIGICQNVETKTVPTPKFATPFEIVAYINQNPNADLEKLRQGLRIRTSSDWLAQFKKCNGGCKAEVLNLSSKRRPNDVVVRVSYGDEISWYYFYERLFPALTQDIWRFYGSIDWFSYGIPEQEIKEKDGKSWIVIRGLGGKGTGVATYYEGWHNFDGTMPKVVLWYPYKGHDATGPYMPGYVSRLFRGTVESFGLVATSYIMKVNFSVTYEAVGEDQQMQFSLFTKNQVGYYRWNAKIRTFQLDKRRSTISESELRNVYNFDTLSDADFINYNFRELGDMAARGSIDQKTWLEGFFVKTKESPKTRTLQQTLAKSKKS